MSDFASRQGNSSKRVALAALALVCFAPGYQVYARTRLWMSGATREALEQLKACEKAKSLLGEDIDASWRGWSHGRLRVPWRRPAWSSLSGRVEWWMPVSGTDGRGVLHFMGEKDGGFWKLQGVLDVDGTLVNTRDCTS